MSIAEDYQASLGRIERVIPVLQLLRPNAQVQLSPPDSDDDRRWGIDGWINGVPFGIATQTGNWPTITITGSRASGYPSVESQVRSRIENGEPFPHLTITAYGQADGPAAPYTALYAVRMAYTVDLHLLPDYLWEEMPIAARAEEGNWFKFVYVAAVRAAGYCVWEWEPQTGWRTDA